ncbi:serine hydrolase [Vibrio sp. D404a]|uniref:serine hydrolase domain-containing protein n=1 Tax=unclassified Vibrio TaxID=2614977 RepID=UPI002557B65D|nr:MULTISPECIES: serine hydrolase domain-containing protein [unclassified Vibrio]MDK9735939.1 serine hydrolase [Vibrio sp. D404a]MDK9797895.1 serine hydrolase [Vibrio sp. D449a]
MKLKTIAFLTSLIASPVFASDKHTDNPIEAALKIDGAQINLTVDATKDPFTPEFVDAARASFGNWHWQMGGDHALYYNANMNEFLTTAIASPNAEYKELRRNIVKELDNLKVQTQTKGEMTMKDYLADPQFRTQGFMLIHKGEVVYEAYPGMNPTDRHIWASSAKTTVGLIIAQLVAEDKIDTDKSITAYLPELAGTVWDDVSVLDVINHTTGLDNEEKLESILDPDSPAVRFYATNFGSPRQSTGKVETWLDVAQDAEQIDGEKAGERFRYASINTMILTELVERIEDATFTRAFEDRVWSKTTARQPMFFNQTPTGEAIALGLVLSTLEDKARFGTLFTPSWKSVATEQVVSDEVLNLIKESGNPESHEGSTKQASSVSAFNEMTVSQSYHFDYIFDDGAMAKSGNLGQLIYIDPNRDFVGVMFSTNPYHSGHGENKGPALMRAAAKSLAEQ